MLLGAIIATTQSVSATNIFVTSSAPSTGSFKGASWTDAISLTRALQIAKAGDVIYLAKGTYEVDKAYYLKNKAVTIIGGFAGTEDEASITPSQSNPTANPAIFTFNGPKTYRIFDIAGSNQSTTNKLIISGLTFKNITSNQYGPVLQIYTPEGNTMPIEVTNCSFTNIKATDPDGKTVPAGAIFINRKNNANVTISKCNFTDISSTNNAGAISIATGTTNDVVITIKDCSFNDVSCGQGMQGSAIQAIAASSITNNGDKEVFPYTLNVENCTFKSCKGGAKSHGGKNMTNGVVSAGNDVKFNFINSTISE